MRPNTKEHHPPYSKGSIHDGTVAKVEFSQGLNQIGEDLSVP